MAGTRAVLLLIGLASVAANHYATLGVSTSASSSEIKQAFRKLALKHHPDKVREPHTRKKAEERFKQLTEAYETLGDPEKKRVYDLQRSSPFGGARRPYGSPGADQRYGYDPFGGAGFHAAFHPSFKTAFPGGFEQAMMPPPRARREFYCSLGELDTGCKRRFVLKDTPLTRLRDALHDLRRHGLQGWTGKALGTTKMVAFSVVIRMPRLVFGRGWWLRLPVAGVAFAAALVQQLPPSPEGVYEFSVAPGWRAGTRVVFGEKGAARGAAGAVKRPVAFELRERRHPDLARAPRSSDLLYRTSLSRRAALDGRASVRVPDLSGKVHELPLELDEDEAAAEVVVRRLEGLGLPVPKGKRGAGGDGPERGDLRVEVLLRGKPGRHAQSFQHNG